LLRRPQPYSFRDKVVVITGGSRGLGLVLAREFGREGARVAICARNPAQVALALDDLERRGIRALGFRCDVGVRAEVEGLMEAVRDHSGRIDVLVNNAGTIQVGPMETMTEADYDEAMRVHFWGPLYAAQAVLPEMRRRGDGRIVNIASIGGKVAVPHLLPYAASKFALVGLSEGLRAELAKDGIAVTTVAPWLMRTGSHVNALFKGQRRLEFAQFSTLGSLPLVTVSAEAAARQIVNACRQGDAELMVGWPAELAVRLHGLMPGLTADVLGLVNRLQPGPGGIGTERRLGRDSESALAPSVLTRSSDAAARRNNELDPS